MVVTMIERWRRIRRRRLRTWLEEEEELGQWSGEGFRVLERALNVLINKEKKEREREKSDWCVF